MMPIALPWLLGACGAADAADRLRERRDSRDRAMDRARARDRHPRVARREPRPHRARAGDRVGPDRDARRAARRRARRSRCAGSCVRNARPVPEALRSVDRSAHPVPIRPDHSRSPGVVVGHRTGAPRNAPAARQPDANVVFVRPRASAVAPRAGGDGDRGHRGAARRHRQHGHDLSRPAETATSDSARTR